MKLKDYLEAFGVKQIFLANKTGISRASLNVYALGKKIPPLEIAWRIEKATDGHVTMYDWLSEETDVDSDASIQKEAKNNKNKNKSKKRVYP